LPEPLAHAVTVAARTLLEAGHRAWLVGGAVRDVALGLTPGDGDLASAATPDEIEGLFAVTHAVGKAFGTVVVRLEGVDLQITTFRTEGDYRDGRRPGAVAFGTSLEEDAARRDFTCNALFLDPLTDELHDPTGGLADLAAGRLRCVGAAARRFSEDGLRLLRLARLAAQFGLALEAETLAAARGSLDALRGVSAERVLAEFVRMADGPAPGRALGLLAEPGAAVGEAGLEERVAAVARLGPSPGARRFLATLFRVRSPGAEERARAALQGLRVARALGDSIARTWELERELAACLVDLAGGRLRRSRWIRLARAEEFEDALALWRAWHGGDEPEALGQLLGRVAALAPESRAPAPFVRSADLARAGVPRGPRWSQLLREAEDLQLDGELASPEAARAWLERRAREG
jgi:tRNA nucleotidyltransferase/poly(A) polymerase